MVLTMTTIKKAMTIFSRRQKLRLAYLTVVIFIGSLCELLGITVILPFINVVLDSDIIEENAYLSYVYDYLGLQSPEEFLIVLGILLIVVYIVKNVFVTYMYNAMYKFTYRSQRDLSIRLLEVYMKQPYMYFVSHNSAELMRNLNQDTVQFFEVVLSVLQLAAEVTVCVMLGIYLFYSDPTITLSVVVILGLFMITIFRATRNNLKNKGIECRTHRGDMNKWIMQSTGGIKEIKILGNAEYFMKQYEKIYYSYAEKFRIYRVLSFIPRTMMESLCICSLLGAVIYKISTGTAVIYFIPTLTLFALAAFRLLPSFNRITTYISTIIFNKASVDGIYEDLQTLAVDESDEEQGNEVGITFEREIAIQNLSFCYPEKDTAVLEQANFIIPKSKSIAFVGASGSGKTTLADIILGILQPSGGSLLVDGVTINPTSQSWRKKLGYIPQTIFLMDDTIRHNIALGIEEKHIDEKRLEEAIAGAQLKTFMDSLPEGEDTMVGESGVRLSGGQRQRIGIARALYTNPDILILDEATSALDNETEEAVMDAIDRLAGTKTLIIIAHRLSTIENCDIVYEIKDGKVRANQ